MGKLAEKAKQKAPFIRIEIGEQTPVLVYKAWKEATDNFGNETFRYSFDLHAEDGIFTKTLDNRSQAFAEQMDTIPFGTKVIIKRTQKLDKDGKVIEGKSTYIVEKA